MAWKCPQCGFAANADEKIACDACGFIIGKLVLKADATGKSIAMAIDTTVGKALLRSFAGDEAVYASAVQFRILKDQALGGWALEHAAEAKNKTFVDGNPADARVLLAAGSVITLGPTCMRLTVSIER